MVWLSLNNDHNDLLAENSYWKTNAVTKGFSSFNDLPGVSLSCKKLKSENGKLVFEIQNSSSIPAIGIKLNLVDEKNQIVLPAYFSDGYFTLLPGEKKTLSVGYSSEIKKMKIKTDGYNIKSELNLMGE